MMKSPRIRSRPRIGDVIEIEAPRGFAYAQYTHRHTTPPRYGALLRILPGLFVDRPTSHAALVTQPHRFLVFFPLGAACNRRIVQIVANETVPYEYQEFPVFRDRVRLSDGRTGPWCLWDGQREVRVKYLSPEQQRLPLLLGVWNDTILIKRLASEWLPSEEDAA